MKHANSWRWPTPRCGYRLDSVLVCNKRVESYGERCKKHKAVIAANNAKMWKVPADA